MYSESQQWKREEGKAERYVHIVKDFSKGIFVHCFYGIRLNVPNPCRNNN